uniref:Uncharacterized protein n=1 Tax=Oryza meridionalis TaxID=40149 RepID=A0A0E0FC99_9ORYZ
MNGVGGAGGAAAGKLLVASLRWAQWRLADERCELQEEEMEYIRRFHRHEPGSNQCTSFVAKHFRASLQTFWSLVKRFEQPQLFKPFVRKCVMRGNIIATGSIREVNVQSGLPATRSIERLELLNDNEHILQVKFIGGDHMLKNYSSILTVHSEFIDGQPRTLVLESFLVDIPEGNTTDDICYFIENVLSGAGGAGQAAAGRLPAVSLRRAQWRLADEKCELREGEMEYVRRFHRLEPGSNQCSSFVAKHIRAPLQTVWSLVRRFDQPQLFKPFVKKCVMQGNIDTGSVREVIVQSGLPATRSMERLEFLDDNEHILRVKFIGGDHMLKNYTSTLTVHSEVIDGQPGTLVIESFVVDIPQGNSKDDICYFVENLLRCNLRTLADVTEESLAGL